MNRSYSLSLVATALLLSGLSATAETLPPQFLPEILSTSLARSDAQAEQVRGYWKAKAQCWADLSSAEASQGDTHGTAMIAAGNSRRIQDALEAGNEPDDAERPIFSRKYVPSKDERYGRPMWRADIETIDGVLNRYRERKCRTAKLGCLEVAQQSVYENMEETRGARWNHGRPEIDKALQLASEASAEFVANCSTASLEGIDVSKLERPLEVIEVPADTLFKFGQAEAKGLLPGGSEAIAALASKVKGYGTRAGGLRIVGHTDRLGSPAYNERLSQQRASTVADLIKATGVALPMTSTGVGSAEPTTGDSCKSVKPRQALIDCLQPDRRVGVRILPATR
ncbi:OmpA-OmpF porin, OOP family [Variovorax sp. HW608]|uniref:OmpA family protein n=1 Tax=Variovorax sp. HW608 TaxID=1034889 RepID=UPI0008200DA1|nr:OmpA family protein [Variovorax sp. HW608]SCK09115.1 OmpA-OmpF porin, OOP family [Variovorax sp. HW608]